MIGSCKLSPLLLPCASALHYRMVWLELQIWIMFCRFICFVVLACSYVHTTMNLVNLLNCPFWTPTEPASISGGHTVCVFSPCLLYGWRYANLPSLRRTSNLYMYVCMYICTKIVYNLGSGFFAHSIKRYWIFDASMILLYVHMYVRTNPLYRTRAAATSSSALLYVLITR